MTRWPSDEWWRRIEGRCHPLGVELERGAAGSLRSGSAEPARHPEGTLAAPTFSTAERVDPTRAEPFLAELRPSLPSGWFMISELEELDDYDPEPATDRADTPASTSHSGRHLQAGEGTNE